MESNWIEIKRFLNDYKKIILLGAVVIAALFTVAVSLLETSESEPVDEAFTEDFIHDAKPAYFQVFMEHEDGIEFGNSSIIEEYFTLDSVIEDVKKETSIDLKAIKKELKEELSPKVAEELKLIHVTRHNSSYLWTATFNVGDEQKNKQLAKYYFDLLLSEEISLLDNKKIYVFEEPRVYDEEQLVDETEELEKPAPQDTKTSPMEYVKNVAIGWIVGIVAMIGILLLKVIYGRKLEYSFAYAQDEEHDFVLIDEKLANQELISHYIASPYATEKVVLSEQSLSNDVKRKITQRGLSSFGSENQQATKLTELSSFVPIKNVFSLSELIVVVQPTLTNRKWYKKQIEFAELNNLPVKIIQVNP